MRFPGKRRESRMPLPANDDFPPHALKIDLTLSKGMTMSSIHKNEDQAVRPLSHNEMELVNGGSLQKPPIHGGPVPAPILPAFPAPIV